jgi:hypothetical protein
VSKGVEDMGGTHVLENVGRSQSHDSIERRGFQNRAKRKPFGRVFAVFHR